MFPPGEYRIDRAGVLYTRSDRASSSVFEQLVAEPSLPAYRRGLLEVRDCNINNSSQVVLCYDFGLCRSSMVCGL